MRMEKTIGSLVAVGSDHFLCREQNSNVGLCVNIQIE